MYWMIPAAFTLVTVALLGHESLTSDGGAFDRVRIVSAGLLVVIGNPLVWGTYFTIRYFTGGG